MARGKWILISGIVVFLAIAAGALSVWFRERAAQQKPAPQVQKAPEGPRTGDELNFPGHVEGKHMVEVPASIDGILEKFHTETGQEVFEGQLLASIKNTKLESARDLAQNELDAIQARVANLDGTLISTRLETSRAVADATRARTEFDRTSRAWERQRMLFKEGATPRLVYEKAEKEYLAAKEEYDLAKQAADGGDARVSAVSRQLEAARRLANEKNDALENAKAAMAATEVHAPADGIVVARRGEPGVEVTRDWKDLLTIATELGELQVTIEPPPPVLAKLKPGQPAQVFLAEAGAEPLPGAVSAINGTKVVVEFRSPSPEIKPGMTAQVRVKIQ